MFHPITKIKLKPVVEVFGRCKKHPRYQVKRPPKADCARCRQLWLRALGYEIGG